MTDLEELLDRLDLACVRMAMRGKRVGALLVMAQGVEKIMEMAEERDKAAKEIDR